ncbi:LuxR family transcriptional regulator [Agromyces mariniharenae]|nr:LuxR family transcriptional regulator [Agromyces mariniharenae]
MPERDERIRHARELHRQARWDEACREWIAADAEHGLGVEDLELLGEVAQLTGRHEEAVSALERAFELRSAAADLTAAATGAFWLYSEFLYAGELARAGGWMARLGDLAETLGAAEPGWLSITEARRSIVEQRYDDARTALTGALAQGRERGETDLETYAILLTGRSMVTAGRIREGMARLEDAMVRVTGGQTSPRMTSMLYCAAIGICEEEACELAHAQEWARALERWMASFPTSYGGALLDNCRVYRAALLRRRGQLPEAEAELDRAARNLADGNGVLVAGHACYELGEVHRLLGQDEAAEVAYRRATALGRSVQPGLALLRLRQGDLDAALHGLRRAVAEETGAPAARARLLPSLVTVSLEAGEVAEAERALAELDELARNLGSSALDAEAARARAEVELAAARPEAALPHLRRSSDAWRGLSAPYETARTGVLIARACRALGDEEGARVELESARQLFTELGTTPDLRRVESLATTAGAAPDGLSEREIEVLRLVAAGMTNRAIAAQLYISERTVHRHISNIFGRIGVNSRAAAAAYAAQHHLLP